MGSLFSRIGESLNQSDMNGKDAVREMRNLFDEQTRHTNELMSLPQCIQTLAMLNVKLTEDELRHIIDEVNAGSSLPPITLIDFPLFMNILQKNIDNKSKQEMLREAFDVFDMDGIGIVAASDIVGVLRAFGNGRRTEEEITSMMSVCGVKDMRDGVTWEHFLQLVEVDGDMSEDRRRGRSDSLSSTASESSTVSGSSVTPPSSESESGSSSSTTVTSDSSTMPQSSESESPSGTSSATPSSSVSGSSATIYSTASSGNNSRPDSGKERQPQASEDGREPKTGLAAVDEAVRRLSGATVGGASGSGVVGAGGDSDGSASTKRKSWRSDESQSADN